MFDYFGGLVFILILSWITNKVFYVFWLVPIYILYLIGCKIWGFMGQSQEEAKEEPID